MKECHNECYNYLYQFVHVILRGSMICSWPKIRFVCKIRAQFPETRHELGLMGYVLPSGIIHGIWQLQNSVQFLLQLIQIALISLELCTKFGRIKETFTELNNGPHIGKLKWKEEAFWYKKDEKIFCLCDYLVIIIWLIKYKRHFLLFTVKVNEVSKVSEHQ